MARQILVSPPSRNRRHPLLYGESPPAAGVGRGGRGLKLAEVAGGTAAECAAVCCCCPCGLMNLIVLAVCRLPAGLCRKALRRQRRRRLAAKGLGPQQQPQRRTYRCECGCDGTEVQIHPVPLDLSPAAKSLETDQDVIALEKEMWERFYGTGFWRSPSQREL